jgi:DNA adenine methylase
MRYSGSKKRFVKQLLPILLKGTNDDTLFIDAFGGGMNVVCAVPLKNKWAVEINCHVHALWGTIQGYGIDNLYLPKDSNELTQEHYEDIRRQYIANNNNYPNYLMGFVGTCCSYGGAWFNGYAHFNPKKNEDHIKEAYNGLKKQVEEFINLNSTLFINGTYHDLGTNMSLDNPENTVIYCDPPYFETKKYESDFDHIAFWNWVRTMTKQGIRVYVSEYTAPDDFKCIWEARKKDGMGTTKKGKKQNTKVERLFVYNG